LFNPLIGEYFKNNGDRYEGEWKNGEFNGQGKKSCLLFFILFHALIGKIFWRRGSRYEGKWRNGRLHGQGKKKSDLLILGSFNYFNRHLFLE